MKTKKINIARDFSPLLGPRFKRDGSNSGEKFRETILEPALFEFDIVEICLDGLEILSASFFEEAFGGLVRKHDLSFVKDKVRFVSVERPYLIPKIERWIDEAAT